MTDPGMQSHVPLPHSLLDEANHHPPTPRRVLVVDDEALNRELFQDLLNMAGYDVRTASRGPKALEVIAEWPPDVVLLDAMMPGMTGYEVAAELKKQPSTQGIPIVMVTSLHHVDDKLEALRQGVSDFLTKPVNQAELMATVRNQMQIKAYHDHLNRDREILEREVARRTAQVRLAYDRLRQSSLDTIAHLARAAEYRDEDTGQHVLRMSHYSAVVARAMNLGERVAQSILHAAPMHDVGKIGIPDQILLKPGKLTPDEWELMKTHTTIGANILRGSNGAVLRLGEVIALTHHERWDGSGYPLGLSGRRIPLVGRITAIADVFDALTSLRPYKQPFSVEKSLDIINRDRGSHFDPAVVDAFLGAFSQILEIKEQFRDQFSDAGTQAPLFAQGGARPTA